MRLRSALVGALVFAIVNICCGGGDSAESPAAPTMPTANLVTTGTLRSSSCFAAGQDWECKFEGEMKNTGQGCASGVRGVTRLFYKADNKQFSIADWTLAASMKIRPGETVIYSGYPLRYPPAGVEIYYKTEPSWDSVWCN